MWIIFNIFVKYDSNLKCVIDISYLKVVSARNLIHYGYHSKVIFMRTSRFCSDARKSL